MRPVHLRAEDGAKHSPEASLQELLTYFRNLFRDPDYDPARFGPLPSLPFTEADLESGFRALPLTKALRPDLAPAGAWRMAAKELAHRTFLECQQCLCQEPSCVPDDWNKSRLCLLPKPRKAPNHPSALRGIVLQHPVTKVITGVLATKAQEARPHFHKPYPVFAYMPGRSTSDCLLTIFQHIRETRDVMATHAKTRVKQSRSQDVKGGLMVTIDLTKAFDTVCRQHVSDGLKMLSLEPELEQALNMFLAGGTYEVLHKGLKGIVQSTRGIKQGSKEAPFEWGITTIFILDKIAKAKGLQWLQQHVVVYADDFILRWSIQDLAQVQTALRETAEFLHVIESHGLQVNTGKSAALLGLAGGGRNQVIKRFTRRRKDQRILVCKSMNEHRYDIPLVQKYDYLGATISYQCHERETMNRRLEAARHAFNRLKPILHDFRNHGLRSRLHLYHACVWSTATYGILEAGLQHQGATRLHGLVMKHLRSIARSPSHVTHESNHDLLARLRVKAPLDELQELWVTNVARWRERRHALTADDICLHVPPFPDLAPVLQGTKRMNTQAVEVAATSQPRQTCDQCSQTFQNLQELKRHQRLVHKTGPRTLQPELFDPLRDALTGTWNCAHCHAKLQDRRSLRSHICYQACPSFDPDRPPQQGGLLYDVSIARLREEHRLEDVLKDADRCKVMTARCVVCDAPVDYANKLRTHLSTQHPQICASALSRSRQLHTRFKGHNCSGRCCYCQAHIQSGLAGHKCPVLLQLAVLIEGIPAPMNGTTTTQSIDEVRPCSPERSDPSSALQRASESLPVSHPIVAIAAGAGPAGPSDSLPTPLQALMNSDRRHDPEPPPKARRMNAARKQRQPASHAHELDTPEFTQQTMNVFASAQQQPAPNSFQKLDAFRFEHGGARGGSKPRFSAGGHGDLLPEPCAQEAGGGGLEGGPTHQASSWWEREGGQQGPKQGKCEWQPGEGVPRSSEQGGATFDSSRGHLADLVAGVGVHGLHAGGGPRIVGRDGSEGIDRMAQSSGLAGHRPPTAANADECLDLQGVGAPAGENHGGDLGGGTHSEGVDQAGAPHTRRSGLALHAMECGSQEARAAPGCADPSEGCMRAGAQHLSDATNSRPSRTILRPQSPRQGEHDAERIGNASEYQRHSMEIDRRHASTALDGLVSGAPKAMSLLGDASGTAEDAPGKSPAKPRSSGHSQACVQEEGAVGMHRSAAELSMMSNQILHWRWVNDGMNLCYANASVTALAWSMRDLLIGGNGAQASGGGDVMHDTWLQTLMQPINPTSVPSCTRSLLDLLSPVPAFAAWCVDHPVGAQQDAAEFTNVLLAPMFGLYSGIAESRQSQKQTRVIDIGHMIMLDVPEHRPQWTLQDLMEEWHLQQGPMQALTRPVPQLCIRLGRRGAAGLKQPMQVGINDAVLYVPYFSSPPSWNDSENMPASPQHAVWLRYRVEAIIQHHGPDYRSGHYTAALVTDFPNAVCMNDAHAPEPCANVSDLVDAYLVWLSHVPWEQEAWVDDAREVTLDFLSLTGDTAEEGAEEHQDHHALPRCNRSGSASPPRDVKTRPGQHEQREADSVPVHESVQTAIGRLFG